MIKKEKEAGMAPVKNSKEIKSSAIICIENCQKITEINTLERKISMNGSKLVPAEELKVKFLYESMGMEYCDQCCKTLVPQEAAT